METPVTPIIVRSKAGDFLSRFPAKSVNTINADPPYGTGNKESKVPKYTRSAAMAAKNWDNFKAGWDSIADYLKFTLEWMEPARDALADDGNLLVWGTLILNLHHVKYAADMLGMWSVQALHWTKTNPFPNLAGVNFTSATESVIWIRKSKKKKSYYDKTVAKRYPITGVDGEPLKNLRDYFLYPAETWVGNNWKHPSRKPVKLTSLLLDAMTPKGSYVRIADPFAGSGTTGVSAQAVEGLNGEVWLGDNDPGYVKDILARRLFPEPGYSLARYEGGDNVLELPVKQEVYANG